MMLSLSGRLQTRLLLAVFVALPWALLAGTWFGVSRAGAVLMVLLMTGLGLLWELVYHGLQQRRWDKDWPSLLALLSGAAEYAALRLVLLLLGVDEPAAGAGWFFVSAWLLLWVIQQGPLRVLAPRWRFQGGRAVQLKARRRPTGRRAAVRHATAVDAGVSGAERRRTEAG
ncbi:MULTISPECIES: hypothetical protein [Arthrobacter]|uniref:Uncharacterized protein n=2 Tax=Arthrobacter TaxID=1663 RepID=A0ABU9KP93_9MICC|nr:hypothetical protein [Arthrobacter sp. YJM1]MDP5228727.1 hypothetical protein [Arthrobacter sp. YJM1]